MIEALITLLIVIIVVALVAGLCVWLVRTAPFIQEPFKQWIIYLIYVIAVLAILLRALPLLGVAV